MQNNQSFKYLVRNKQDLLWGLSVTTVGKQVIEPGYEEYPPRTGHPSDYYFSADQGRILDTYVILYIAKGCGQLYLEYGNPMQLKEGDMLFLKPNKWHSYFPEKSTGWTEYWICFSGIDVDTKFQNNFFRSGKPVYRINARKTVVNLFEKAIETASLEKPSHQQWLAGIGYLLMGICLYESKNETLYASDAFSRINDAKQIIRENLTSEISLEEIADKSCMSYSWFRKLFKKYTGLSPNEYITEIRIQKAKEMLSSSEISVKEIAYTLQFGSISYFSMIFKNKTGLTPSEFRIKMTK